MCDRLPCPPRFPGGTCSIDDMTKTPLATSLRLSVKSGYLLSYLFFVYSCLAAAAKYSNWYIVQVVELTTSNDARAQHSTRSFFVYASTRRETFCYADTHVQQHTHRVPKTFVPPPKCTTTVYLACERGVTSACGAEIKKSPSRHVRVYIATPAERATLWLPGNVQLTHPCMSNLVWCSSTRELTSIHSSWYHHIYIFSLSHAA